MSKKTLISVLIALIVGGLIGKIIIDTLLGLAIGIIISTPTPNWNPLDIFMYKVFLTTVALVAVVIGLLIYFFQELRKYL